MSAPTAPDAPAAPAANVAEIRADYGYLAKLQEQSERYDEMVASMKTVAKLGVELTVEERNLLSVAYKNVVGARRASWRIVSSIEQKEEGKASEANLALIVKERQQIEQELRNICDDILALLDSHLIPSATTGDSRVFYYKMSVLRDPTSVCRAGALVMDVYSEKTLFSELF